jgi:hypothetical protein
MSLDTRLTAKGIVWQNVKDGIVDDIEKYLFDNDSVIELNFTVSPSVGDYAKIDLSNYKVRSILEMGITRYNDYRSSTEITSSAVAGLRILEYALHGRMIIIKADTVEFNLKLRFIGCLKTSLKQDVENELKSFYLALLERNPTDIYSSMDRLNHSYKNTSAENSQNYEVERMNYSIIKLNAL